MTNLTARLTGVVCLATAGASTLLHRAIVVAAQGGPAQLAEFAVGLLTFVLASLGVVLLTNGARLFDSQETVTQLLVDGVDASPMLIASSCRR